MAEQDSGQEKTEEPTPRKLEKAREDGQVPRSKDLGTTLVLVTGALGLVIFGPWMAERIGNVARYSFSMARDDVLDSSQMSLHLLAALQEITWAIVPWFALVTLAAFFAPISVGGWLFSTKAITPKLSRMNPLSGLKRMFSMNSLVELFKSYGKVLVVGLVAYLILSFYFADALSLQFKDLKPAISYAVDIILWSIVGLCASTLLIAIVDVPWQIYSHTKKLRMSMQDIKDEYKETEGKPEVKSKIRQLQREMSQRQMMQDVAEADVVITNPSHYSVALKYQADSMGAPVLVAKGFDQMAFKIREIAKEHNVPRMEAPPLARALFVHANLGEEIPEGLYTAVAQVLAYLYQMDMFFKGQGPKPDRKPAMPIPSDLRVDPDPE